MGSTIGLQKPGTDLTSSSAVPGGGGLETLPGLRNNLPFGSRASFSSRGLNLEKGWRERCSWRGLSITLIVICLILASLLTFTGECHPYQVPFFFVYMSAIGKFNKVFRHKLRKWYKWHFFMLF